MLFVKLKVANVTKSSLTAKISSDLGIVPKGFYMLFMLNKRETSSKAKF
jgi:hypothetical protein